MKKFSVVLLQADGQLYNRGWIIGIIIMVIVAVSWFIWHRRKRR